jgi:iron complex transport system substrate-binding protein
MRVTAKRAAIFLLLLMASLASAATAQAEEAAKRIITLGGDITEIVYRLGEEGRLAGRDTTSKFPEEAKALPDVGYFRQIGAEGLLSLKPDLILASPAAGPPEALQQIAATGVKIVRLADGHSGGALLAKVQAIAAALGVKDEGERLASDLRDELAEAAAAVAAMPGRPKILFIIDGGGGAPMAAGRDTAADALIALAGGENVFSSHKGYKAVSLEAAAGAAPDAIAMWSTRWNRWAAPTASRATWLCASRRPPETGGSSPGTAAISSASAPACRRRSSISPAPSAAMRNYNLRSGQSSLTMKKAGPAPAFISADAVGLRRGLVDCG